MAGTTGRDLKRNDRRSVRTRRMLGRALVELMLEKRYDTITVQEIIDRANVGRSTFYAHFMDKEDLLQNETAELIERLVLHTERAASSNHLIPSLAMLRHVFESHELIRALVRGRAMGPVLKMMQSHFSLHVETRLARLMPPGATPAVPLPVIAQYVSGTLLTLFQWWHDREMPESPEQLDEYYINLIRPSVRAATGVEI